MHLNNAAVLVTGAASGIGRSFVVRLAKQYACKFTLADVDVAGATETLRLAEAVGGSGQVVECDVSNTQQQERAFQQHLAVYGRLDVAFLNAGIMEKGDIAKAEGHPYLLTLDVNLRAVVVGANLAARAMTSRGGAGVILMTASAGGLYPMPHAPVYAAAKAGVVNLARSMAPRLRKQGVAVHALCPQYADTPLVRNSMAQEPLMREYVNRDTNGRIMGVEEVIDAAQWMLLQPLERSPITLFLSGVNGRWYSWPDMKVLGQAGQQATRSALSPQWREWATTNLPTSYQKMELHRLSTDFGSATRLVSAPVPGVLPAGHVLIRRAYAGINASDVNFSAGRYFTNKSQQLPCPAGFEAVGVVAAVGADVQGLKVGAAAATLVYGGFAEFAVVPARQVLQVDTVSPQVLALLVSGLTASIALEQCGGKLGPKSTVMVTAAAGGTGQFAVQLAKATGATVIATCSSKAKSDMLRGLGADRVINYKTEDVKEVLQREYPRGLDCVYESVGGKMFTTCVNALATGGRCIIIGMIEEYSSEWKPSNHPGLVEKLLWKSATVSGFFLLNHTRLFRKHLDKLQAMLAQGKLTVEVDSTRFVGLQTVPAAVEYLHSGKSAGKVYVQVAKQLPDAAAVSPGRL